MAHSPSVLVSSPSTKVRALGLIRKFPGQAPYRSTAAELTAKTMSGLQRTEMVPEMSGTLMPFLLQCAT